MKTEENYIMMTELLYISLGFFMGITLVMVVDALTINKGKK